MEFKIGNFVTIRKDETKNLKELPVYIVKTLPTENTDEYEIIGIYTRGLIILKYQEEELKTYTKEIKENTALGTLRKIILGEIKVNNKTWLALKNGKVSFDDRPNYKTILRLKE